MIVTGTIGVYCDNKHCPDPADTKVARELVAPKVVVIPRLVCRTCGSELRERAVNANT